MDNSLMFSSANQAWATRWECYYQICKEFNNSRPFDLDPCAEGTTAKCDYFFTKEQDMFSVPNWNHRLFNTDKLRWYKPINVFMNPEYGRAQPKFIEKCIEQVKIGAVEKAAILIPARTDTKMFHKTILNNAESVTFYEGRLVFGSDEYWEFVWSQEYMDLINPNKKGQKNELFGKVGKFNAAPFPSMVVIVTQDSIRSTQSPIIKTLKAPKFKYEV